MYGLNVIEGMTGHLSNIDEIKGKLKCVDETQLCVVVQIFFFKAKNGPQFCCPPDPTQYNTQWANCLPEGSSYTLY